MVEMTKTGLLTILFSAAAAIAPLQAQQIKPRIAGLENNETYMALLRDDAALQMREDSLAGVVARMRSEFRERGTDSRGADAILSLESEIFDVRNRRGLVTAKINMIEQSWVLDNIGSAAKAAPQTGDRNTVHTGHRVRNLVYNDIFARTLRREDYESLKRAQLREREVLAMAERYAALCDSLRTTAAEYAEAENETTGVPLYEKFGTFNRSADSLAGCITSTWGEVYDDKNFAYGYLLEQLDREDLIEEGEKAFTRMRGRAAESYGRYGSDAVADFVAQRAAMLEYEALTADGLGLSEAADSVRTLLKDYDSRYSPEKMPAVNIRERLFLDYAPVEFSSPSRYNAKNPIPECRVYERGTIYRILLGTFWAKQAISVFRGAAPLGFLQMNGRHLYFAGGFRTRSEADAAAAALKKAGFKSPVTVVWRDGVYRNLATDPEEKEEFGIEIFGLERMPESLLKIIDEQAEGCEISRAGNAYVVGMFGERAEAERVAEALKAADESIEVKITGDAE